MLNGYWGFLPSCCILCTFRIHQRVCKICKDNQSMQKTKTTKLCKTQLKYAGYHVLSGKVALIRNTRSSGKTSWCCQGLEDTRSLPSSRCDTATSMWNQAGSSNCIEPWFLQSFQHFLFISTFHPSITLPCSTARRMKSRKLFMAGVGENTELYLNLLTPSLLDPKVSPRAATPADAE